MRAIIAACCNQRPERLQSADARFSWPVYPGETIRIDLFEEGATIRFRAVVADRDIVVLDRCTARLI